jgi:Na+/H+ antiporter NhaD/arsenite permease-like protein
MTNLWHNETWMTSIIFFLTYLALAFGKVPGLKIDRTGIALVGAAAMLATGLINFQEAAAAVDMETIVLLTSMMLVVAYLHIAGFFELVTNRLAARCRGPHSLLAAVIAISGILSALLVNDVVCVALTPLVLGLCQRLRRPPVPYLLGLATASNVGSVATITGNPQNIIIGSMSGISYLRFAERLAPIAVIGLVLNYLVVAFVYRKILHGEEIYQQAQTPPRSPRVHRAALVKGLMVTAVAVAMFFVVPSIATVALTAAGVLLLDGIRPEKLYRRVDWALLMMFAGLFVVVHPFELHVVRGWGLEQWTSGVKSPVPAISGLAVVLSNLVSNVPAVLLFKPLIGAMSQPEEAWFALAMASTLAGNLTLLGSVANLIVVESARRSGIEVSFLEYLKVGIVLTLVTTLVGVGWLMLVQY